MQNITDFDRVKQNWKKVCSAKTQINSSTPAMYFAVHLKGSLRTAKTLIMMTMLL